MFQEPNEIKVLDILGFINSREICVVKAKNKKDFGFNKALQLKLFEKLPGRIICGSIDISKVDFNNAFVQTIVKSWMTQLGLPVGDAVPPGYYLFQNGNIKGYHPGTFELEKIDPQIHGGPLVIASIAGFLVGVVEKNASKGFQAFMVVFEFPQGVKIFEFFLGLIADKNTFAQERQRMLLESELLVACRLLGISQNATSEQIRKARNEMLKKYHPDKKSSDFEKNNKIAAEINHAYDLIMSTRGTDA